MKIIIAAGVGLNIAFPLFAADPSPTMRRPDNKPIEQTEWRKEAKGFLSAVIVTPDADWKEKWNTPFDHSPHFNRTDVVRVGEKVWVLNFISGALADTNGDVDVTCDLTLVRPNGKIDAHKGLKALRGKVTSSARNSYLSEVVLEMVAEESDPQGEWRVELVVHDRNRGVALPLVARFILKGKEAQRSAADNATGRAQDS